MTYTDAIDKYFTLGAQMKQRDTKPVRKTVSGLIKLMLQMETSQKRMYASIWYGQ